jgi:hypothetical protein
MGEWFEFMSLNNGDIMGLFFYIIVFIPEYQWGSHPLFWCF